MNTKAYLIRSGLLAALATAGVGATFACGSSSSSSSNDGPLGRTSQADTSTVDLISTGTCTLRSAHLVACKVGPDTLVGHNFPTAVPLRTVLTPKKTGNCATSYPLQVTATADDGTAVTLQYLSATNAYVRRADKQSIAHITLTDSSPWTATAAFDSTCDVELGVAFNEPDVDTVAEAQAILANLQAVVAQDTTIASNYHDLLLFSEAYKFMSAVANNFYAQLTSDTMQQLRAAGSAASNALLTLITSCNVGLSQQDQMNLAQLYATLPVLGMPSAWQTADGGTLTIADIIGPTAQAVLDTVNSISAQHNIEAGTGYDVDYTAAEQALVTAQAQLELAQQQLSAWIPVPDAGAQ